MATPKTPTPDTLKMHDLVFNQFNQKLVVQLPWLDYAFGQCQILTKQSGDKIIKYPGVYAGQNIEGEYLNALPNEELGNTSFFIVKDPINVETRTAGMKGQIKSRFGLIMWFNLKQVLSSQTEYRNLDLAIANIMEAIRISNRGWAGEIRVTDIYKRAENIYKEFSYREVDEQFLMMPFAGLRFEGEMKFFETC